MTLMNLGWNELTLGSLADAETTLRRALTLVQRRFQGRVQAMESLYDSLGLVLSRSGKHDEAIEILERNLRENPGHPFLAYNHVYLAQARMKKGDLPAAREAAEAALQAALANKEDPAKATEGEAAARMALAQILLEDGDAERALKESETAMDLLQRLGGVETFGLEIPYTHGRILRRMGRLSEARAALEIALQRLDENAAKIAEEPLRLRYREQVAVHQGIDRLFQEVVSDLGTT
jgi:tetratricopeptide (TPR) repeat protein